MFTTLNIINFLSYATIGIMFVLIADLKYTLKASLITFIVFIFSSFGLLLVINESGIFQSVVPTTILAIPAFIFSAFIVKKRDFQFVFSFFTATTIGYIIYTYSRFVSILFDNQVFLIIGAAIVFYSVTIYALKRFRTHYINLQNQIQTGWVLISGFSLTAYVLLSIMSIYPTKISERLEDAPVFILVTFFIGITYIIIFRLISKDVEMYNEKRELAMLELDSKYHKSQMELKDIYYRYAYEDAMTMLKNRRAFEEEKIKKITDKVLLMTIDINDLKLINDQHGHQMGDRALIALAKAMKQTFSEHHKIYRIGGDEFVLILDGLDGENVLRYTEKIEENLTRLCQSCGFTVSVSIGWCCSVKDKVKSIEEMVKIADERMYEIKRNNKLNHHYA